MSEIVEGNKENVNNPKEEPSLSDSKQLNDATKGKKEESSNVDGLPMSKKELKKQKKQMKRIQRKRSLEDIKSHLEDGWTVFKKGIPKRENSLSSQGEAHNRI